MLKFIKPLLAGLTLVFNLLAVKLVLAQNAVDRLRNAASQSGYSTNNVSPQNVIASIIVYVLSFLGLIFLGLIIYAGFQWMTAGGNEDQIKTAKQRLGNAVIGLAIVLAAYAITVFVFRVLIHSTTQSYYAP